MRARMLAVLSLALAAGAAHAEECQGLRQVASLDAIATDDGVIVPLKVGGQEAYFAIEPEVSNSDISEAEAKTLGLAGKALNASVYMEIDGHRVTEAAEAPITLGTATSKTYLLVAPGLKLADPRAVGELGIDFLRRFEIEFDLAHGKINLFMPFHCKGQVIYWTHSAPVAALAMKYAGLRVGRGIVGNFTVPLTLDGKELQTAITLRPRSLLSSNVAHAKFGIAVDTREALTAAQTFKALDLPGLRIANPAIALKPVDPKTGCEEDPPAADAETAKARPTDIQCVGHPDLFLGLAELRKLRLFVSFQDQTVYVTAADAS